MPTRACDCAPVMQRTEWANDTDFTVGDVAFQSRDAAGGAPATSDQMILLKPRFVIERYEAMLLAEQPQRILELGIYAGGSTALLAQLARPERLVALDVCPVRPKLERFIDEHDLRDSVRTYYGIDQANTDQLDQVLAEGFGGAPLDLVIDDASHLEAQTRASFNHLFPQVRPGGAYIIEDWSWPHQRMPHTHDEYQDVTPLSVLICQLVLAAACRPQVIAEVVVDDQWALVRRGPAALKTGPFDLDFRMDPVSREMLDRMAEARTLSA